MALPGGAVEWVAGLVAAGVGAAVSLRCLGRAERPASGLSGWWVAALDRAGRAVEGPGGYLAAAGGVLWLLGWLGGSRPVRAAGAGLVLGLAGGYLVVFAVLLGLAPLAGRLLSRHR